MNRIIKFFIISFAVILLLNVRVSIIMSHVYGHELVLAELNQINTTGQAKRVEIKDNLAFVTDSTEGVKIYNISNPINPELIGQYKDGGYPLNLFVYENYVYYADHENGLKILDISDLSNPTLIGNFSDGGNVRDVYVMGDLIFLTDWFNGLEILNNSYPANPVKLSEIGSESYALDVVEDLVFVTGKGLKIYNVSDPQNPIEVGNYYVGSDTFEVNVDGTLIYLAAWDDGIFIADISDPTNLEELGQYVEVNARSIGTWITDEILLLTDYMNGLLVLNISNFSNISKIGHFYDGGEAHTIQVVGNLAYIADGSDGLEIIQLWEEKNSTINSSTPSNNAASESIDTPGFELFFVIMGLISLLAVLRRINFQNK